MQRKQLVRGVAAPIRLTWKRSFQPIQQTKHFLRADPSKLRGVAQEFAISVLNDFDIALALIYP
jgi:hypothetical protein